MRIFLNKSWKNSVSGGALINPCISDLIVTINPAFGLETIQDQMQDFDACDSTWVAVPSDTIPECFHGIAAVAIPARINSLKGIVLDLARGDAFENLSIGESVSVASALLRCAEGLPIAVMGSYAALRECPAFLPCFQAVFSRQGGGYVFYHDSLDMGAGIARQMTRLVNAELGDPARRARRFRARAVCCLTTDPEDLTPSQIEDAAIGSPHGLCLLDTPHGTLSPVEKYLASCALPSSNRILSGLV